MHNINIGYTVFELPRTVIKIQTRGVGNSTNISYPTSYDNPSLLFRLKF